MPAIRSLILLLACVAVPALAAAAPVGSFADLLRTFEAKAIAAGISPATYRRATAGLTPDPAIEKLVSTQPEFTTPIWDYIDRRVSASRIARGQQAFAANRALFERIGSRFGVDPYVLAAIWGMETDYGAVLGNANLIKPVIRSLATLVHERRGRLVEDEGELIAALTIIDKGWATPRGLVGSWAGALGHLQISASGYLRYRTDGDGDGRIDVHRSLADALATSATFLKALGYMPGVDWGFEVELPKGFDYLLADRETLRPVSFFAERGVRRVKGRQFSDLGQPVFLYVPAGANGPKFLMTGNYLVLKGYNFSDSYALSVAHLTDRLKGSGDFAAAWPRGTKFPDREQRVAIQKWLKEMGYYDGAVDGRIGPVTQAAYQAFQAARGEVADGFITLASYRELASGQ